MIWFNGAGLEAVAPVMIEDIRVSPIQRNVTARQRPIQAGADFVRVTDGQRTVTITFGLLTMDPGLRQGQLDAVKAWARSDQPQRLELPYHEGVYLMALATELPAPSARQWWESKLRIVFTCYDPYWVSLEERSAACGSSFTVLGDAPPLMQIRRTLASTATAQTYYRPYSGQRPMNFTRIIAGNLVIDLNRQTADVDGAVILGDLTPDSVFLPPQTGTQTIEGVGTVYWRERWA